MECGIQEEMSLVLYLTSKTARVPSCAVSLLCSMTSEVTSVVLGKSTIFPTLAAQKLQNIGQKFRHLGNLDPGTPSSLLVDYRIWQLSWNRLRECGGSPSPSEFRSIAGGNGHPSQVPVSIAPSLRVLRRPSHPPANVHVPIKV